MKFLEKFLKINPEIYFFYLFILSIPLSIKLTFLSSDSYFTGHFLYYTTHFIYLSDILLITTLILWFVKILYNKQIKKSSDTILNKIQSAVNIFYKIINLKQKDKLLWIIYGLLYVFVFWSLLSLFWAKNTQVGLYQCLKFFELVLLFIFVIHKINTAKTIFYTIICIISTGFTQAIIGIWQYFLQKSIGLKILGESVLSPDLAGVAKIAVDGEKMIRAYGTFPHPNVFAGFLLFSIICCFYLLFLVKTGYFQKFLFNKIKQKWLYLAIFSIIFIQFFAFILTFSRVGWTAMAVILFLWLLIVIKNVSRETFVNIRLNKRKIALLFIILSIISYCLFFIYPQISARIALDIKEQAFSDRLLFNNIAFSMIKENFIHGVGIGNFTLNMANFAGVSQYAPTNLDFWQYQPVHNIYLLIFSELGIIGFAIFISIIFCILKIAYLSQKSSNCREQKFLFPTIPANFRSAMFHVKHFTNNVLNKPKNGDETPEIFFDSKQNSAILSAEDTLTLFLSLIFIGFLFIGLFDHYFWTIQQGQLIFWLIMGFLIASSKIKEE